MLFEEAKKYLAGGVSSPVRAFKAVGGKPVFMEWGRGAKIYDVAGKGYIDLVCSWGPLILGHAHPRILQALNRTMVKGTSFGAPNKLEIELAKLVNQAFPSMERVRFVSSGTEATMSAIRLARGFTGRDKIVKFAGCYHGHVDSLLVKAGSGLATLGLPGSLGVPPSFAAETIVVPFNNLVALERALQAHQGQVAAVIVEPVPGNMGVVLPRDGYLLGLRQAATKHGVLLIFDEVISGFRVAYGGAQELYQVKPDLTCLGKIIGGGLPVGAFGGRREIMRLLAPDGGVYQAGTLSGNPLAMTAGIATLKLLRQPGLYQQLDRKGAQLAQALRAAAQAAGQKVVLNRLGSMLTMFFCTQPVVDYETAQAADLKQYRRYFHHMLEQGVYLPPSQFEACFLSTAHQLADLNRISRAARRALTC